MIGVTLALLVQGAFQIGDRVEAMPLGTRWEPCTVIRDSPTDGGYGLRCDSGSDYFVAYKNVRAGQAAPAPAKANAPLPAARRAGGNAPPGKKTAAPQKSATATTSATAKAAAGGTLPIGKTLKCYYLAGTVLNYSLVDVTFTGGSTYKDRRGASGAYTRKSADIRFTSGPLVAHRAQAKPGGVTLFAPNASFGMSCT